MRTILLFSLLLSSAVWAGDPPADRFSFDLYRQLARRDGNLFFSGYSIHAALGMVAAGARGETAEEMREVLALADGAHERARDAIAKLQAPDRFDLTVANALWPQSGWEIEKPFVEVAREHYGAPVIGVDFSKEEEARGRINAWVREHTNDRIRDLVPAGALTSDTRLVLTNAIWFKARWARRFPSGATAPAPFHLGSGDAVKVPTMQSKGYFRIARAGTTTVVEIPYEADASLVIAMPKSLDGFRIDAAKAASLEKSLEPAMARIHLPKFKVAGSFDVVDTLRAMGLKRAFSDRAEFAGICANEPLLITNVLHKSFVAVDEIGTEAAAATATNMRIGALAPPKEVTDVPIDRPFVFWIRHRATGIPLFVGRVVDPR